MPIKIIEHQRRMAEQGRIRLGDKGDRGQPQKLSRFRFTSTGEQNIRDLAELYGGKPQPWDNGGKAEWEVYSDSSSIPVYVVKGGLTQWLEYWQGGGCIHRCDGETNQLTNAPCDLAEQVKTRVRGQDVYVNPHEMAKPTTRVSMMLPELESIGWWRLESHGWNAAVEIPAVAELAQFVGDLVPAALELQERRTVKDGKTSRFVVPVLDLKISTHRLREIVEAQVSGTALESAPGNRPALEAPASSDVAPDGYTEFFERLAAATSLKECQDIWSEMKSDELVGEAAQDNEHADPKRIAEFIEAYKAKGSALPKGEPGDQVPDEDGAVDAEWTEDPPTGDGDPDVIWQQIVLEAGKRDMLTADLEDDFAAKMGGLSSAEASFGEMQHYLGILTREPAA